MRAACVTECVSWGPDGPAVIGTDKPCVEECTGKGFMGTQGKEVEWERRRKGDNEYEECGKESGVIVGVLERHEKENPGTIEK